MIVSPDDGIILDERMELRLNALISVKSAIMPGFCASQEKCGRACRLFNDESNECYWMKALKAIDDLESIVCGGGHEIKHDTKPERSTKEQSRFDGII